MNWTTNEIKDSIADYRKQRSDLVTKYRGVRPSWVSTDVAILSDRIDQLVEMLRSREQSDV